MSLDLRDRRKCTVGGVLIHIASRPCNHNEQNEDTPFYLCGGGARGCTSFARNCPCSRDIPLTDRIESG